MPSNNDLLANRYRQIPYGEYVHASTHPAHIGAVARLFGVAASEPQTARILELAVGRGSNLNWIAGTLPNATCRGVDLVVDGIEQARAVAAQRGLTNVTFEAVDLLETDFDDQQFDYVIAHGFMAWTSEPVQQRILEVCRDHLAPGGIALVSYNAMPGSAIRDSLRQLFLLELEESGEETGADEQLAVMEGVMSFFEASLSEIDSMPHSTSLKHNLKLLRQKPSEVLLHDEGGVISEPLYLLQFTQWASETGLAYIADTDLRLDWLALLPESVRQTMAERRMPRLKALQYADYLRNCPFRSSLLCRSADAANLRTAPDAAALPGLQIRSLLVPERHITTFDTSLGRFRLAGQPFVSDVPQDGVIEVTDPLLKTFLNELAGTSDQSVSFAHVWRTSLSRCGIEAGNKELSAIGKVVLESVCLGRMKLSLGPP